MLVIRAVVMLGRVEHAREGALHARERRAQRVDEAVMRKDLCCAVAHRALPDMA